MSQIPQPAETDVVTRLLQGSLDKSISVAQTQSLLANPFETPSFDEQGRPTYTQPRVGFFGSISERFSRSGAELRAGGTTGLLQSVPEFFSGRDSEDYVIPGQWSDERQSVIVDGEPKPASSVRIETLFDTMSDADRSLLELNGLTLQKLNLLQQTTAADFAEFYPEFVRKTRADEALRAYGDEHTALAYTAGAVELAGNTLGDPLFLAGLFSGGFGSAIEFTGKTAVKETVKSTLEQTAKTGLRNRAGSVLASTSTVLRGPTDAVIRRYVQNAGERAMLTRGLTVGGGGITGFTYATSADLAAQKQAIELGLQDPDLHFNMLGSAIGTGLGMFIGEAAFRGARGSLPSSGRKILASHEDYSGSLASLRHVNREVSESTRLGKQVELDLDLTDVASSDFVQDILEGLYSSSVVSDLADHLARPGVFETTSMQDLAAYLSKLPTYDELLEAVTDPAGIDFTRPTRYMEVSKGIDAQIKLRDSLVEQGLAGTKPHKKALSTLDFLVGERESIVSTNFAPQLTPIGRKFAEALKDRPLETIDSFDLRVKTLAEVNSKILNDVTEDYRSRSLVSNIQAKSKYLGSHILNPRQPIKADIASADKSTSFIGRMTSLINSKGLDNSEVFKNTDGSRKIDVRTRHEEDTRKLVNPITSLQESVLKEHDMSVEDVFSNVMRHRVMGETLDPRLTELNSKYFNMVDEYGRRGLLSGTINNRFKDFAPFSFNRINAAAGREPLINSFKSRYAPLYDLTNDASPVNYKALARSGFLERDKSGQFKSRVNPVTGEDYFEDLPKTLGQLDPEVRKGYEQFLDASINEDAAEFYQRLLGNANREIGDDVDADAPVVVRTNSIDPLKARVVDQAIYLDQAVLDSGIINMDLVHTAHSYNKTRGYDIARDEAVNDLYGEKVGWRLLTESLRAEASGNAEAYKAYSRLIELDRKESNRFTVDAPGAKLAATVNNLGAALVAGSVPLTGILPLEIAGGFLRTVMGRGEITSNLKVLRQSLERITNKEQLIHLGILHEADSHSLRFLSGYTDHLSPENNTPLVQGTRWLSNVSRTVFLEKLGTASGKSLHYGTSFAKLHYARRRLDRLIDNADKLSLEGQDLKGVARSVGMDVGELELMRDFGLTSKESLTSAKKALEFDKDALISPEQLYKVVMESQDEGISNLYTKLTRFAKEEAETFVSIPSSADRVSSTNPLVNLMSSMLSFATSFYNNAMTRMGRSPYWKQMGFWSFILGAEVVSSVMRDLLYGGESMDTIIEKWEEEPVKHLASAVSRVPIQSPMSLVPNAGYALASGQPGQAVAGFTGSASLSMVGKGIQGIYSAGKSTIEGDELTDAQNRVMKRYIPGYNSWIMRLMDELPTKFEEDSDK